MNQKAKLLIGVLVVGGWMTVAGRVGAVSGGQFEGAASAGYLGETAGNAAGWSVSGAGDVNGDGYDDFLVGAFSNDDAGSSAGAAYLVLGGPAGWSLGKSLGQPPLIQYSGEAAGDQAGYSVSGAGDVNGDGYDDLLVGAFRNNDAGLSAGAAYLVLGDAAPAGGSLSSAIQYTGKMDFQTAVGDFAGYSVSGAGDVNGDGYDDFLVGAYQNADGGSSAGAAYLVLGGAAPAGGSLSSAIQYTGKAAGDFAGYSVSGAGDVNGDGYDDLLVGAIHNSDGGSSNGAAYLVLGGTAPAGGSLSSAIQYTGKAAGDQAGTSVSGAGDVNGDGYGDLLVGANQNSDGGSLAGAAYLVLGGAAPAGGSLSSAIQYTGEATNDKAGTSVSGAGDVNGDGYDDLLVGAFSNDDAGSSAGAAYLVLGDAGPAGGSLSSAIQYKGKAAGDIAGTSVSGAGDVNGDGYDDLLVGAPFNDNGGTHAGAAYLVLGDVPAAGAEPYRHRQRLAGSGDTPPLSFRQAGVTVDFSGNALSGADVAVSRHLRHPCDNSIRLAMPIWDVESGKMDGTTTVDLTFNYNDGNMAGMNESNLALYRRDAGQPCAAWTLVGGSSLDTAHNRITAAGLTRLGQFTIADAPPSPTAVGAANIGATGGLITFEPVLVALLLLGSGSGAAVWRRRQQREMIF